MYDWTRGQGVTIVPAQQVHETGPAAVAARIREVVGEGPAYLSFDIDGLDPAFAPGTGTPEIGGLTTHQAQRMIRSLDGLDLVGADLVEVSPPFDPSGLTAWTGVNLIFELLCVLARAVARRAG
jgi:guanidinopropionase